ncbi:MAG: hypothetical protein ACJ74H_01110 [Thermoanaerobaculia bacterium]
MVPLCASAAQDDGGKSRRGIPQASPRSSRFTPTVEYEEVFQLRMMRYPQERDYPDYNRGFDGSGTEILENGVGPRGDWALGVQTGRISGGGCVPSPADPALCENLPGENGAPGAIVWKEREMWTFRVSYIDPSITNAPEVNIGFNGAFGYIGDDQIEYIRRTEGGHECFSFYPCDYYGVDLPYITGSVRAFEPYCGLKLGAGYRMQVFYQYSRYRNTQSVPAGAQEWEPATVPATATRLEKPGKVLWTRNWRLGPRADALHVGFTNSLINPQVEPQVLGTANATGGTIASIPPGETDVVVTAFECNGAIPGVSFTLTSEQVEGSGGHIHNLATATRNPPAGAFSNAPTTVSGITDANGQWRTRVRAGRFSGQTTFVANTPNIMPGGPPIPMTSPIAGLYTGFILRDFVPHPLVLQNLVKLTGHRNALCAGDSNGVLHCDNHRDSSHNGRPELHGFIELAASLYNESTAVAASNKGRLGVNDMSLPLGGVFDIKGTWGNSHQTHRFGVDVDFDSSVFDSAGAYHGELDLDELTTIIEDDLGGQKVPEQHIHFRMSADIIDQIIGDIRCSTCSAAATIKIEEQQ